MTKEQPKLAATTTVSTRYQTVIPSEIREKFAIHDGSRIAWIDRGDTIEVVPLPERPRKEFRGAGHGQGYTSALTEYRTQERDRAQREARQVKSKGGERD